MSLSVVYTRAALGVNAPLITIEVHISQGLPGLVMVGLPETTVKESRDRVRSAIINSGYAFPAKKSPSTWLRLICQRRAVDMIYLSLLRSWQLLSSLTVRNWGNMSSLVNWRLRARCEAFLGLSLPRWRQSMRGGKLYSPMRMHRSLGY